MSLSRYFALAATSFILNVALVLPAAEQKPEPSPEEYFQKTIRPLIEKSASIVMDPRNRKAI